MMMKTKNIIFLPFIALLLVSCEKQIDFEPEDVSPYVVMVSKPEGDSLMSVYLGRSRFFLDNRDFGSINDATVTLTAGGVSSVGIFTPQCFMLLNDNFYYEKKSKDYYDDYYYYDTIYYDGYTFTLRPRPGDTVRLSAIIPGVVEPVTATTVIPNRPHVEILDFAADTLDEAGYSNLYYRVRIRVYNEGLNFFGVSLSRGEARRTDIDSAMRWDSSIVRQVSFEVNDALVNNQSLESALDGDDGSFSGYNMYFSSELFSGGYHDFTLEFSGYWKQDGVDQLDIPLYVNVTQFSEDLYRYNLTTRKSDSDLDELFAEPVQVYCNINGGIGILGGSTKLSLRAPRAIAENFYNSNSYFKKAKK